MVEPQPMEEDTRAGPGSWQPQAQLQWVPRAAALQLLGLTVPSHEPRGAAATRLNPSTVDPGGNSALTAWLSAARGWRGDIARDPWAITLHHNGGHTLKDAGTEWLH